jgi:mono/diheme cytochrome c family protein
MPWSDMIGASNCNAQARLLVLLGLALFFNYVFANPRATAQTESKTKEQLEQLVYDSVKGPDLFRTRCAVCHGSDGKGAGPMAPVLKAEVPDLTVLAKNNRGQFPSAKVRRVIMGEDVFLSHGYREMPIWGPIFRQADQDFKNVRVENLVKYLESIQHK